MADNIVGNLFGISPEQLMQQRQLRDVEQQFLAGRSAALPGSMMSPSLAPFYQQAAQQGQLIGKGIGALLGAEDPELQKVSQIKQLSSQFDLTSSTGMRDFARSLQAQFPQEAMMAAKRADEMDTATGARALTARKVETEGNQLAWVGVDGQPDMKQQAVIDKATGAIIRRVGDPISVVTSRSSTTVKLPEGESEFVKQLGKNDANTVTKVMETRGAAVSTLQSLEKLEQLNDQQLISGTFAEGRVGAANLLNTLGLASKADVSRIASSQQYGKVAKDVIFQTLGGKLGAGFSNEDRKFIEALIPQLESSGEARRQLISYMKTKNKLIADESTRLENYAREKKGLGGFEYKIPRETLAPADVADNERTRIENEIKKRKLIPQ